MSNKAVLDGGNGFNSGSGAAAGGVKKDIVERKGETEVRFVVLEEQLVEIAEKLEEARRTIHQVYQHSRTSKMIDLNL